MSALWDESAHCGILHFSCQAQQHVYEAVMCVGKNATHPTLVIYIYTTLYNNHKPNS